MKTYFNIKTASGIETIDQLDTNDFKTLKDFRIERKRLKNEYLMASSYYGGLYYSQRSTNDWKQN
jgi:hypothetical protein